MTTVIGKDFQAYICISKWNKRNMQPVTIFPWIITWCFICITIVKMDILVCFVGTLFNKNKTFWWHITRHFMWAENRAWLNKLWIVAVCWSLVKMGTEISEDISFFRIITYADISYYSLCNNEFCIAELLPSKLTDTHNWEIERCLQTIPQGYFIGH